MELSTKQQIADLIKNSKNILLTTHVNVDGDAIGSILAFYLVLKKLDKNVTAVSVNDVPPVYGFLPEIQAIKTEFAGIRDFVVSVYLANAKVDKLSYKKIAENKLNIVISPKEGNFSPEDVSFSYGESKFDLIFVLDAPDLDRLGAVYDNNTDLFYETPIINIDHHPGNEYFGKINWVDLTATSTSEILVSLIESLSRDKQLLDAEVATCLLTGITEDTGSFQNTNTTPKSLTIAAQMVAAGARQQEIIQKIYKTKQLSTLKLWGAILSRIVKEDENFIWSYADKEDFIATGSKENETKGVLDELLKTVPNIDFALLLSEKSDGVHGSMRATKKDVDVSKIAKLFNGGGHQQAAAFQIKDASFEETKMQIIQTIKEYKTKDNINNNQGSMSLEMPEDI